MKPLQYEDFLSPKIQTYLKNECSPITQVPGLQAVGATGGLETPEALKFLCELYDLVHEPLHQVLKQRKLDRDFIDQRTRASFELNKKLGIDFLDPFYETVIGHEDANGRIVIGPNPKNGLYSGPSSKKPIAPLPDYLKENHVTLFGPPDSAKLSINAMNSFHRKMKNEPKIVEELLKQVTGSPKWGADDEDSKTPLHEDLTAAGTNLTACFERTIEFTDPETKKKYQLESRNLLQPIKRFPGLALPCSFLFYRNNPIPLHLYDFALHLFRNFNNPEALCFYVPKLENEEEAAYLHTVIETAEKLIQKTHPQYTLGTIRLMIVLENPRVLFRVHEIIDKLFPYFAGASLGWHDYLASTARLMKHDSNYRIPVKADPNIVIQYIKASHDLLANTVGSRGGIKVGGMYGVLPIDQDPQCPSFQITLRGFFKDIITQLKRNLSGFWVAHPDFVRLGVALVQAYAQHKKGSSESLRTLVTELLEEKYHSEILDFISAPDVEGLDPSDPLYPRELIVATLRESKVIQNHHPDEIRYNVFQSLQYLADWLSGNGCVALPAQIDGVPVRVMDDLATAERSRWEVWHEIHHGRFSIEEFLKIAYEEFQFIRKDRSNSEKIVQVKWDTRTEKWYPIAFQIMIQLMTQPEPPEFATELLLPFTIDSIRNAQDPWQAVLNIDEKKFSLLPEIERFNKIFSVCGSLNFAHTLAGDLVLDLEKAQSLIQSFTLKDIIEAASFHGDIGENKKTLDERASKEQALVSQESDPIRTKLRELGNQYLQKFGFKYLISAQGKSAFEILENLQTRLNNSSPQEIQNARNALWEISLKRFQSEVSLSSKIEKTRLKHKISNVSIAICTPSHAPQALNFGKSTPTTWFQLASLSKTIGSCFAIEYFKNAGISLSTSVNFLLEKTSSPFRIQGAGSEQVTLKHLMNHQALNLHYVNGVPLKHDMPRAEEFLNGNKKYAYLPIQLQNEPGSTFQYSGGGFLVLEHLIEARENRRIQEITRPFLDELQLGNISFEQKPVEGAVYPSGSRKMFPAFAAGASGTSADVLCFLKKLTQAFHSTSGCGPISHDTAIHMLQDTDRASQNFMGVNIGLGVFIAEAGPNRIATHQGANDGYRCLFIYCYSGPDQGNGFVILCDGDDEAVPFIAETAQLILSESKWDGVDLNRFQTQFNSSGIAQEEIVNLGYKELIFSAFQPDLPEAIDRSSSIFDPLSKMNLAIDGKILEVSNERFARAENLLSPYLPTFDPELYGRQGKIMDSWESVRHNRKPASDPHDFLIFELKNPSQIHFASFSTQFHLGNHAPCVSLEGRSDKKSPWQMILSKTPLEGHSLKVVELDQSSQKTFRSIRVSQYPDGGLTRLGLYEKRPPIESKVFEEAIPHPKKPLTPKYKTNSDINRCNASSEVDVACSALGGKIIRATNEHYSPAIQMISPYPPLHMFDGAESSRSREKNHSEEVVIQFARPSRLHRIEVDFTFFINNNPEELKIDGLSQGKWISLFERRNVKAYAGNILEIKVEPQDSLIEQIKITVFPDGGINRLRAYEFI